MSNGRRRHAILHWGGTQELN